MGLATPISGARGAGVGVPERVGVVSPRSTGRVGLANSRAAIWRLRDRDNSGVIDMVALTTTRQSARHMFKVLPKDISNGN